MRVETVKLIIKVVMCFGHTLAIMAFGHIMFQAIDRQDYTAWIMFPMCLFATWQTMNLDNG